MNKIQRSGKLLKAAFAVLLREKKLLLFPLIATAFVLVMALFFIVPVICYPTGHPILSSEHWSALGQQASQWVNLNAPKQKPVNSASDFFASQQHSSAWLFTGHPWTAAAFVLLYFISMFFATFSNVAFYHEIMRALNGDQVSIRRGYRFACERWRAILLWSLFAGLVGYLIQTIQERFGFVGRIITGLIGFVWSTACIFVIPTLVRDTESANPLKLLRNSVGTLRRTWGELVIGFVGLEAAFGLVFLSFMAGVVVVVGLGVYEFHANLNSAPWIVGVGISLVIGLALLLGLLLSWLSSIVNPIYRCALYIYATEGVVPGTFDKELLDSAWKVK